LEAIKAFENFSVPHEYQYQTQTRGAEFLLELAQNMELQDLYRQDPKEAVSEEVFPGLSPRERLLLSNCIEDHAQIAAKGHLVETSPNERLAIDLHRRDTMARAFRAKLVEIYRQPDAAEALNLWLAERGYQASLAHFATANERLNASMLLPWTGIYATPDYRLVLIIIGSPDHNNASLVYANLTRIKHFSFNNSTLTWAAENGNPNHAMLVFKMPDQVGTPGFVRSISGKYWTPDTNEPAVPNLQADEVVPGENPLSVWTSQYETEVTTDGATWSEGPVITVATPRPNQSSNLAPLLLDGQSIKPVHYDDTTLTWGTNRLTFAHDPQARDGRVLSGQLEGYWTGGMNLKGSSLPHYRAVPQ
jgi:hypothetical protein